MFLKLHKYKYSIVKCKGFPVKLKWAESEWKVENKLAEFQIFYRLDIPNMEHWKSNRRLKEEDGNEDIARIMKLR